MAQLCVWLWDAFPVAGKRVPLLQKILFGSVQKESGKSPEFVTCRDKMGKLSTAPGRTKTGGCDCCTLPALIRTIVLIVCFAFSYIDIQNMRAILLIGNGTHELDPFQHLGFRGPGRRKEAVHPQRGPAKGVTLENNLNCIAAVVVSPSRAVETRRNAVVVSQPKSYNVGILMDAGVFLLTA